MCLIFRKVTNVKSAVLQTKQITLKKGLQEVEPVLSHPTACFPCMSSTPFGYLWTCIRGTGGAGSSPGILPNEANIWIGLEAPPYLEHFSNLRKLCTKSDQIKADNNRIRFSLSSSSRDYFPLGSSVGIGSAEREAIISPQ